MMRRGTYIFKPHSETGIELVKVWNIYELIEKKHNKIKNLHSLRSFGRAENERCFKGVKCIVK